MTWRDKYLIPLLIVLVGLLIYANTFSVPFQFDDEAYIVNNPVIRSFHYFLSPGDVSALSEQTPTAVPFALRYAFRTRIMGYLSFAVNYHLNGLHVAGYHGVNLAIHILSALLVYLFVLATLRTAHPGSRKTGGEFFSDELSAGLVALLFVSHPIQTQAVTYLSQRFASFAALFSLAALFLYSRAAQSPPGMRKRAASVLSFLSVVAAMLTKEFTFTLPFLIALYDSAFLPGSRGERLRRLAPFGPTLAIIPALVFMQQGTVSALDSTMRTITAADASGIPRFHYMLTQFRVVLLYLRLLFFPMGQNVDHDIPVYTSLFDPAVIFSLFVLLALFSAGICLFVLSKRKREFPELRLAAFGIFWFFITLSVESSIIPLGELAAEYRLYLPSVGFFMSIVSLGLLAARRFAVRRAVVYGLCVVVVSALSISTVLRNMVWSSEISLWEDAARKSPALVRPHQNLGTNYMMKGNLEDAERELLAALRLAPDSYELHNNLGILYKMKGDYSRAVGEFMAVSRLSPSDPMAHYNLGNVYLLQGNLGGAIGEYLESIRLAPDYDEAHNNLGIAYARSSRCDRAVEEFRRALSLNPENRKARENLAACERAMTAP